MSDSPSAIAVEVMRRLNDPQKVADIASQQAATSGTPGMWEPAGYATGFAGLAVAHLALSGTDPEAEGRAHEFAHAAVEHVPSRSTISIASGFGSVAAAFTVMAAATGSDTIAASRGLAWLAEQCDDVAAGQHHRWNSGEVYADERMWDALCGLAGAVRILTLATCHGVAEHTSTIKRALTVLVRLTYTTGGTRGWQIPAGATPRCPDGGHTPGVAHGISGPLVTLAAAYRAGVTVPGHAEAIATIAAWLLTVQGDDGRWPETVPTQPDPSSSNTGRSDSWCYGTAGIARALCMAGTAVGDCSLVAAAVDALTTIASTADVRLRGPTFCHGHAGLVRVAQRTYADTKEPAVADLATNAGDRLAAQFDPGTPWGFTHTGDDSPGVSAPGVLIGAAGVALCLVEPAAQPWVPWDVPLMTA